MFFEKFVIMIKSKNPLLLQDKFRTKAYKKNRI